MTAYLTYNAHNTQADTHTLAIILSKNYGLNLSIEFRVSFLLRHVSLLLCSLSLSHTHSLSLSLSRSLSSRSLSSFSSLYLSLTFIRVDVGSMTHNQLSLPFLFSSILLLLTASFLLLLFLSTHLHTQRTHHTPNATDTRSHRWRLLSVSSLEKERERRERKEEERERACVNSVGGRTHVVDDRGRVCERGDVERNGCCSLNRFPFPCKECCPFVSEEESVRILPRQSGSLDAEVLELIHCKREEREREEAYVLTCCGVYELCVSCCMLQAAAHTHADTHTNSHSNTQTNPLSDTHTNSFASNLTADTPSPSLPSTPSHFPACLSLCRTNSCSIVHQKVYVFPRTKYCFGNVTIVAGVHASRHRKGQHGHCRQLEWKDVGGGEEVIESSVVTLS